MSKLTISSDWWSAPAEAEDGRTIIVTGRSGLGNVKETGKFTFRVEVTWPYEAADAQGMPSVAESQLMEQAQDALEATFSADPVAVNTGIYTGAGERNWVFYCRSLHLFQKKLNEALAELPALPLTFSAEEDPNWEEYAQMMALEVKSSE